MVAYEFYCLDSVKGYDLFGVLPERRKDPGRITDASVINWGKMVLGKNWIKKGILYKKVIVTQHTGKFFRITPHNIPIEN